MKNKYYIDNKGSLSDDQVSMMKRNYRYVAKALSRLFLTAEYNDFSYIDDFINVLSSGRLPVDDEQSGFNTSNLAGKLRALTESLRNKDHPENIEKFRNSVLYKRVLTPLVEGDAIDVNQQWSMYEPKDEFDKRLRKYNAFDDALICNKLEPNAPIGLDFAKILDSCIKLDKKNPKNCYFLEVNDDFEMLDAVQQYLKDLKNNEIFRKNYKNTHLKKW